MQPPKLQVTRIVSLPFEENAYVAHLEGKRECLVVDPGLEPEKIIDHFEAHALVLVAILNTHGHSDHIGGNAVLKERWPDCRLVIGAGDAPKLTDPTQNLSAAFGFPITSPPADVTVSEGDRISAGRH